MSFVYLFLALCMIVYVQSTPLDDYVKKLDLTHKYEEIDSRKGRGYTIYTLNMTSQKWLDGEHFAYNVNVICVFLSFL